MIDLNKEDSDELYKARRQLVYVLKQLNSPVGKVYKKDEQSKLNLSKQELIKQDEYDRAYKNGYNNGYNDGNTTSQQNLDKKLKEHEESLLWKIFLGWLFLK